MSEGKMLPFGSAQGKLWRRKLGAKEFNHLLGMTLRRDEGSPCPRLPRPDKSGLAMTGMLGAHMPVRPYGILRQAQGWLSAWQGEGKGAHVGAPLRRSSIGSG